LHLVTSTWHHWLHGVEELQDPFNHRHNLDTVGDFIFMMRPSIVPSFWLMM